MGAAGHLCRDCLTHAESRRAPQRCPQCGSPRVLYHDELFALSIAHIDCDAFYASVEKRDDPSLVDKPLIVGGGQRGVVSTCCYLARMSGVRSAMPMFQAKRLCPDAVVIKVDMPKYVGVSRQIRAKMDALTPLVQPLSIDEAFLDLSGTEKVHKAAPAVTLARLAKAIEDDIGVTISVGLSHNKFLAKIASELDKPRGFAVIGVQETVSLLATKPISVIFGVGKVMTETLRKDGLVTIGDLQARSAEDLMRRYGEMGARLAKLSRGEDYRKVSPERETKSVSTETTFFTDLADFDSLSTALLSLCERLSERLKKQQLVGDTISLKLKTAGFRTRTRAQHVMMPTQLATSLYEVGRQLLAREIDGTTFRLLGIGVTGLEPADGSDPADLIEPGIARKAAAERAMDRVRDKFGRDSLVRGKLYRQPKARDTKPETDDDDRTETQ
ncbi:DNA polymerase IV [Pelagibacterium lacus]|uniref:DNA polymerase IV n=1 Tax=Pelagibacterium lacus TaxID=2282655 RepID=A0A369W973_9HYPH|nr:DNA polymerase IV [Pelagibacterium lacus]RDE09802.1 DNA polymerase IV [Pelagibacterium lacus]